MKAVWYERNGPAAEVLKFGDIPDPMPSWGEVRVRLHASGINPSDVKTRAGAVRKIAYDRVVPHSDGAGVIDKVGPSVPPERIGQRVWVYNGNWKRAFGTAAEYITIAAHLAIPMPDRLSFQDAACIGIPVMTAHRAVFADGGVQGSHVLVQGGAGAVGHYAVQLAKWGGAKVITTVNGPEKAAHAAAAGADHVIDYRQEDVVERVLKITSGEGVERVVEVDLFGNIADDAKLVREHGIICCYGSRIGVGSTDPVFPTVPLLQKNITVRLIHLYNIPVQARSDAIRDIGAWAGIQTAKFAISKAYSLDQAVVAHEAVEQGGKLGQVVLAIN